MMLVLREIVSQAVVADRADYDEFKNKIEKCQIEFETSPNPCGEVQGRVPIPVISDKTALRERRRA